MMRVGDRVGHMLTRKYCGPKNSSLEHYPPKAKRYGAGEGVSGPGIHHVQWGQSLAWVWGVVLRVRPTQRTVP